MVVVPLSLLKVKPASLIASEELFAYIESRSKNKQAEFKLPGDTILDQCKLDYSDKKFILTALNYAIIQADLPALQYFSSKMNLALSF